MLMSTGVYKVKLVISKEMRFGQEMRVRFRKKSHPSILRRLNDSDKICFTLSLMMQPPSSNSSNSLQLEKSREKAPNSTLKSSNLFKRWALRGAPNRRVCASTETRSTRTWHDTAYRIHCLAFSPNTSQPSPSSKHVMSHSCRANRLRRSRKLVTKSLRCWTSRQSSNA
ncbi:hypothetical protein EE612_034776 [Oryza sativa]|nr:hypothetical protein EE612_034776 [Oryza sativa]